MRDGENVERTVTLRALGVSEQMLPPQPNLRQPWLITFTAPEERSIELTPAGPVTTVVWRWTLRPITGEPGVLPQVTFPWFDTVERVSRSAVLRAAPFGYAGFGANTKARWQSSFSGFAWAGAALAAGVFLPLLLLSPRGRRRRVSEILAPLGHLLPRKDLMALKKAYRQNDLKRFRETARRMAESFPDPHRLKLDRMLADLDRQLFGPAGPPQSLDTGSIVRAFEAAVRSSRREFSHRGQSTR